MIKDINESMVLHGQKVMLSNLVPLHESIQLLHACARKKWDAMDDKHRFDFINDLSMATMLLTNIFITWAGYNVDRRVDLSADDTNHALLSKLLASHKRIEDIHVIINNVNDSEKTPPT